MIQFGNDKIKEIYHGSDKIKEVYYGSELVWFGFKPSYMILTDDRRINFEIENTPIAGLCNYGNSMVINGVSYTKNTIKEIHFESSYNGVTEIGTAFLYGCTSLTDITLNIPALNSVDGHFLSNCSSLTNVTLNIPALNSVNNAFLYGCTSLIDITLNFPALNSVGSYFLSNCSSLTNVTLTTETPPITSSSYFLNNTPNLSSIYVPANSVNLYLATVPWDSKSGIIKAI